MREIVSDDFYEFTKQYDMDREHHLVGEVDYHLLSDDEPYDGLRSHREALKVVFDELEKRDLEDQRKAREMFGDRIADQIHPWIYDIDKAQSKHLDPQEFFYCPNIVKTDYYGNVWYDAEWKHENCGTTVPYWYAVLEPVYGRRNKPEDFKKVNEVLFPKGTDALDIYEWTTDWSDYFDAGHEWYGACCWSIYDKAMKRYVVMLVSATD
ncbi:MAG: hypothetical protein II918_04770 [Firmicutes bacterium]|nr:hypothetical protein [Bacillota bacterium]